MGKLRVVVSFAGGRDAVFRIVGGLLSARLGHLRALCRKAGFQGYNGHSSSLGVSVSRYRQPADRRPMPIVALVLLDTYPDCHGEHRRGLRLSNLLSFLMIAISGLFLVQARTPADALRGTQGVAEARLSTLAEKEGS